MHKAKPLFDNEILAIPVAEFLLPPSECVSVDIWNCRTIDLSVTHDITKE